MTSEAPAPGAAAPAAGAGSESAVRSASGGVPAAEAALASLRSLLLSPEQRGIEEIRTRLDDEAGRAEEVARVLAEAVVRRCRYDRALALALEPVVTEAVAAVARQDPEGLAGALHPALGAAAAPIAAAGARRLGATLHRAYRERWSPGAWILRRQARRSGRPLADLLDERYLAFRVEKLVLLDGAGRVRAEARHGRSSLQDEGVLAGIVAALQEFVREKPVRAVPASLVVAGREVLVIRGAPALIAAVVRGTPPDDLRTSLGAALAAIELRFADELDPRRPGEAISGAESILAGRLAEARRPRARLPVGARRLLAALAVVAAAVAVAWATMALGETYRWDRYIARLRATEGIVVIEAGRRSGRLHVAGLRDPLAADPEALLAESGLDRDRVATRFDPYLSLHPSFVEARAVRLLDPPVGVSVRWDKGTLHLQGAAPRRWIEETRRLARALPGLIGLDEEALTDADQEKVAGLAAAIERTSFHFDAPGGRLSVADLGRIEETARRLLDLRRAARVVGQQARVRVVGHGAEAIVARLSAAGVDPRMVASGVGVGSGARSEPGAGVVLQVEIEDAAAPGAPGT